MDILRSFSYIRDCDSNFTNSLYRRDPLGHMCGLVHSRALCRAHSASQLKLIAL